MERDIHRPPLRFIDIHQRFEERRRRMNNNK